MNTVSVPVSELSGLALDWAVAKCEGLRVSRLDTILRGSVVIIEGDDWYKKRIRFSPSSNWSQGGPIIEREKLAVWFDTETSDFAASGPLLMSTPIESVGFYDLSPPFHGHTLLIAAMRCYVASKLGNTVEVPTELA